MFNNRDSALNIKYIIVLPTCELSTCGVDGSPGVVGREKRWQRRRTVQSLPLLQEVVKYMVKQYLYKIEKITYLKIFTCIIEIMYYIHSS
jgi:hypothetical protein